MFWIGSCMGCHEPDFRLLLPPRGSTCLDLPGQKPVGHMKDWDRDFKPGDLLVGIHFTDSGRCEYLAGEKCIFKEYTLRGAVPVTYGTEGDITQGSWVEWQNPSLPANVSRTWYTYRFMKVPTQLQLI